MSEARRSFDPIGNYNFTVEMDGLTVGRFGSVDGLAFETELIEYRVSDQPMLPRYRPGTSKFGAITLKRGFTESPELQDWLGAVQSGHYQRRDLTITVYDNAAAAVASWNLYRCLPTKWSLSSLDGKGNECLHESIELRAEEIELVGSRARYAKLTPPRTPAQLSWGSPQKDDFIARDRNDPGNTQVGPGIEQQMIEHEGGEGQSFEDAARDDFIDRDRNDPGNTEVGAGIEQQMIDHGPGAEGRVANQTMIEHAGGQGQQFDAYQRSNWKGGRDMAMGLSDFLNSDGHVFDAEAHNAAVSAGMSEDIEDVVQSDASDLASRDSEGEE